MCTMYPSLFTISKRIMQRNVRAAKRVTAKNLHPESRAIKQTKARMRHNMRVQLSKETVDHCKTLKGGKFTWFKVQIQNLRVQELLAAEAEESRDNDEEEEDEAPSAISITPLNMNELKTLANAYLNRNDEELKELKKRRNVPHGEVKRLSTLKETETLELRSRKGMEVPLVINKDGMDDFMAWDGLDKTVEKLPTMRLTSDGKDYERIEIPVVDMDEVRAQRPGAAYQAEAEGKASGKSTVGVLRARKRVDEKVGAKHVNTEEMVSSGRARRVTKARNDTKKRFHAAIALSRNTFVR